MLPCSWADAPSATAGKGVRTDPGRARPTIPAPRTLHVAVSLASRALRARTHDGHAVGMGVVKQRVPEGTQGIQTINDETNRATRESTATTSTTSTTSSTTTTTELTTVANVGTG